MLLIHEVVLAVWPISLLAAGYGGYALGAKAKKYAEAEAQAAYEELHRVKAGLMQAEDKIEKKVEL